MISFSLRKKIIILLLMAILAIFYVTNKLWLPYVSPSLAAKYLVLDDGKNPLNDSRGAALKWGGDIYFPLSNETSKFTTINWLVSNTLLDILEHDPMPPDWLLSQFSNASNDYATILSCYLILRNEVNKSCKDILNLAIKSDNYGEKYLAGRVLLKLEK